MAQQILDLDCEDTLEVVMRNSLEHDKSMEMHPSEELLETVAAFETTPIPPMGYTSSFISLLMISKLNILINRCTKNNKLISIVEARVESSRIGF